MPGRNRSTWVGVAAYAAVLVAATTAAGAVGGRDGQSVARAGGGTLRIGRPADFATLDPGLEWTGGGWQLEFATCAKLYSYPDKPAPEGALVVPEVATGLPTVSRDGLTNTIALRRTFRFNNGERITAANFVAAFNRDANPQLKSDDTDPPLTSGAVGYLDEIKGADAVIQGRATAISGIQAPDRYTLQIQTKRPLPDLVSRLTMPFFCPIAVNTPPRELEKPLGSGPYYIDSHVPNHQLVLKRNPFYGGNRHPHVQQIVYTLGISGEACRVAVEQNQLDYCFGPAPEADYRELALKYGINQPGGRFFFEPGLNTWGFWFNHDRQAFKGRGQIPLKKAINWAIDRHALVAARGYLGSERTDQILPPALGLPANIYPLGAVTKASLAHAHALLAQAKRKVTKLVLYTGNFLPSVVAQAQIFQYDLKRIGIDVEVNYVSQDDFATAVERRGAPYDVFLWGWGADYADASGFFGQFDGRTIRKTGNANYANFNRAGYNGRIDAINRLHGVARRAAWASLDADMMRHDPPWAPFMNQASRIFVSQSFSCFVYTPVDNVDLAAACKK